MGMGQTSRTLRKAIFASILVCGASAPTLADSGQWYDSHFNKPTTIRANLGGSPKAARPSVTGREDRKQASRSRPSGVRTASLGSSDAPRRAPVTGGGSVNWVASSGCLDGSLKSVIYSMASRFGSVTVSSTCRSQSRNRAVGGAPRSKHLTGDAADFRVHGNVSAAYAALRSSGSVGGLKHYGGGLFHIDNGDRRSW